MFLDVCCGSALGQLYLSNLDESKRSLGKCVLVNGAWYTPPEFESLGGNKAKWWRQSLLHMGKPLCDYNLSCIPRQSTKHGNVTPCDPSLSQPVPGAAASFQVLDNVPTPSGSILTPSSISSCSPCASIPCPLLVNTVLSFIEAYRLRGDNDSLKKSCFGVF